MNCMPMEGSQEFIYTKHNGLSWTQSNLRQKLIFTDIADIKCRAHQKSDSIINDFLAYSCFFGASTSKFEHF